MVDFSKLRTQKRKTVLIDPIEIFRRLPKPTGINDLYTSQAEVLNAWFAKRDVSDAIVKLHTGGGKTLVGLLIALSSMEEKKGPVLYLTPTTQLVEQTIEKAKEMGIPAVAYRKGEPLDDRFLNSKAVMVATYNALFNGKSKFGVRGASPRDSIHLSAVVADDAHAAFSVIRDAFTLTVGKNNNKEKYKSLCELFRYAFREIDLIGTFDDVYGGRSDLVIEIPYWAWKDKIDVVREDLRSEIETPAFAFVWPLLRDNLHFCHALISKNNFTITPILPIINQFPAFCEADRRIYMSATIADDSEIVRTFDAKPEHLKFPISSKSLAGISERMILIPDLLSFEFDKDSLIKDVLSNALKRAYGCVVLVPSATCGPMWKRPACIARGASEVQQRVRDLQEGSAHTPIVFSNRYDGIDLPGNSCRLLIMDGLPTATSDYESMRASTLFGGSSISRMLAQRIEQGIGRGARGAGDHCVILLLGDRLAQWIAQDANFRLLTEATRIQLEMGETVSKAIDSIDGFHYTLFQSYDRSPDWVSFHAETLAEGVKSENPDQTVSQMAPERKVFNLWVDGFHDKSISRIERMLDLPDLDKQTKGWMLQLAARVANDWGNTEKSDDFQRQAYLFNKNLMKPKISPPYRRLDLPSAQAKAIVNQVCKYRIRRGFLQYFENDIASNLVPDVSANKFENALFNLGGIIGLSSERHDDNGVGPDVLWVFPNKSAWVIEVKSRKKDSNPLSKEEHGQLLEAENWFSESYVGFSCKRVSVHPNNLASRSVSPEGSYALTFINLASLISDVRSVIEKLCESQLSEKDLEIECARLLHDSPIDVARISERYLIPFVRM